MDKNKSLTIGAHVSISGGYEKALGRILELGGNCMQIFSSSPRSWIMPNPSYEAKKYFILQKKKFLVEPIYFHATYLVNLADTGSIGELSEKSILRDLEIASEIGVRGVVIHTGSFKNKNGDGNYEYHDISEIEYVKLLKRISRILEKSPQNTFLILENSGTRKIGWNMEELGHILKSIGNERLRICLDTCHLYAAGYDLSTKEKISDFFQRFETYIGLEKLELFHLNDSKDELGSFRDRHANIGQGTIPLEEFSLLLHHPKTRHLPFITEVPGFDNKGPDLENLDILRKIAQKDGK